MKTYSYTVVEQNDGTFTAVEWVKYSERSKPTVCQIFYPYPTHEAAAKACRSSAWWRAVEVAGDRRRRAKITCEV